MQVDTILIPAATQMASIAMRPPSSASFSATLASSVSSGAPEDSRNQSAAADTNANSDSQIGANVDAKSGTTSGTSIGSKSRSDTAPDRSASSSPGLNAANTNSKPVFRRDAESDAKPVKNSATVPGTTPSMSAFSRSVSALITFSLADAPPAAHFEKGGLSAPATNLADPSSNQPKQQPLARQLTANLASVTAAQPAIPPPLPTPQPVTGAANDPSPQDQPGPTAISISTATSADPLTNSGAALAPANFPASSEAGAKSSELPSVTGQTASSVAYSFPDVPAQPSAGATQFSTPATSVSPTPTALALLTPISPTLDLPTSAPADTSTPIQVSSAATPADSPLDALTSADVTGFAFDQFLPDQSSPTSVSSLAARINPAPPVPATLFAKAALSQLPNNSPNISSNQPEFSSADKPSPALPTNPASGILPLTLSAQPPIPAPPAPVRGSSFASATESPSNSRSADPKLGDVKVDNSVPGNSMPANSTAAEPAPTSGTVTRDAGPAQSLSSATVTSAAAQTVGSPDAGFTGTNTFTDNTGPSLTSALTPNSNAATPNSTAIVATANDAGGSSKPGVSAQPVLAIAPQATAADKKFSVVGQPNVAALHDVPAGPGSDPSATLTAPATPASAPPLEASSDAAPALPQAHQMLDTAPPAPITPPPAPIVRGSASDLQMTAQTNAQMHVGVRTDAFGAVEIHTVVEQSQVGITVHSDRDISRWFSSEVPGLESGLNNNHLNLTGVNFDHGRSGVQTATSFQQGQQRQHFSQTPGSSSAALPGTALAEQDMAPESTTFDILPAGSSIGPAGAHVSIHV
jgi:hypothetical protein